MKDLQDPKDFDDGRWKTFRENLEGFNFFSFERHVPTPGLERGFFIDNLLVLVQWIVEMIVVERPCAMGV